MNGVINDGFGDSLNSMELQAFYAASVHHTAKVKQPHDAEFDDLVQEGVIAAWKATQSPRKDRVTYGAVSARNRINGMQTGRYAMTGSENVGTKTYDQARKTDRREDFSVTEDIASNQNPFVAVEQRVDMERALLVLEPRDRVVARMVGLDQSWETIAPIVGLAPTSVRNRWDRTIRPALREVLAA